LYHEPAELKILASAPNDYSREGNLIDKAPFILIIRSYIAIYKGVKMRVNSPAYQGLILIVVFVGGVAAGFLGRPFVMGEPTTATTTEVVKVVTATPPPSGQPTPTIMDLVLADARHVQGAVDAPVVIVEFSDFK
jgi:hypothetical protein